MASGRRTRNFHHKIERESKHGFWIFRVTDLLFSDLKKTKKTQNIKKKTIKKENANINQAFIFLQQYIVQSSSTIITTTAKSNGGSLYKSTTMLYTKTTSTGKTLLENLRFSSIFQKNRNKKGNKKFIRSTAPKTRTDERINYDIIRLLDNDRYDYAEISSVSSFESSLASSSISGRSRSPKRQKSRMNSRFTTDDQLSSTSTGTTSIITRSIEPDIISDGGSSIISENSSELSSTGNSTTKRLNRKRMIANDGSITHSKSDIIETSTTGSQSRYVSCSSPSTTTSSFNAAFKKKESELEVKKKIKIIKDDIIRHDEMKSCNKNYIQCTFVETITSEDTSTTTTTKTTTSSSLTLSPIPEPESSYISCNTPAQINNENGNCHHSVLRSGSEHTGATATSIERTTSKKTSTTTTSTTTTTMMDNANIYAQQHHNNVPSPFAFESVLDHPFPLWCQLDKILSTILIPPLRQTLNRSQRGQMIHHLIHFLELKSFVCMIGSSSSNKDEEWVVVPSPLIDLAWHAVACESHLYQQIIQTIITFHQHCHQYFLHEEILVVANQEKKFVVPYEFSPCKYTEDDYDRAVWEDYYCRTQYLYRSLFKELMPTTLDDLPANDGSRISFPKLEIPTPQKHNRTTGSHYRHELQKQHRRNYRLCEKQGDDVSSVVSLETFSSEPLVGLDLLL